MLHTTLAQAKDSQNHHLRKNPLYPGCWIVTCSSAALAVGVPGIQVGAPCVSRGCSRLQALGTHPETGCKGRRAFIPPGSRQEASLSGR